MVAQIVGFDSRATCGLRSPKSRSTRITPSKGGSVVHHGASKTPSSHAACRATWKQYQKLHMDTNGWADVAYTGAFCNHGYALAGRGFGIRTGANGTNTGNQNNYAFVFIGNGDDANELAVNALEWWLNEARTKGGAGDDVRPHRYFTGSTCPSNKLLAMTPRWHRKAIQTKGASAPAPVAELPVHKVGDRVLQRGSVGTDVQAIQRWVGAEDDGRFGPDTDTKYRAAQKTVGIPVNGVVDKLGWAHYAAWVKWRAQLAEEARKQQAAKDAARPALPKLGKFTGPQLSRSRNSSRYHGGVKKAQENLIRLGYMRRNSDEPGRFGDDTERGLIALQKDRGIKANGILGPDTWAELEKWS